MRCIKEGICRDCNIRPINFNRSKRCCDVCLDKRINAQNKYRDLHLDSILNYAREYTKERKAELKSKGICFICGTRPVNYDRSSNKCSECLDRTEQSRKLYYYPTHKKEIQAGQRACVIKNPDVYKAIRHRHYLRHPEKAFQYDKERRGREMDAQGSFTRKEWLDVLSKYDGRCLWCGTDKKVEADHVVPLAIGGTNFIDNIQPLCRSCNSKKHTRIIDFRPFGNSILDWT